MQRNLKQKAQGAIEYLLIIGASILVVAIVIIALVTLSGTATTNTNQEGGSVLNPLQQLLDEQLNTGNDDEPETPGETEPPVNNQIYFVELLETKTIGEMLADAPTNLFLEYNEQVCKKNEISIQCYNDLTTQTTITQGENIFLNALECEEQFVLNEIIFEIISNNYGELTFKYYESKYLYFTPEESLNTIPKIFNDAPDGIYITVQNIDDTAFIAYRKTNGQWSTEWDRSNGLFNTLEETDEAIITTMVATNYSKKISGEIQNEYTQNKFAQFSEYIGTETKEIGVNYALTKDYTCYTAQKILDKIREELQDNYSASVLGCNNTEYHIGEEWDHYSNTNCSNPNRVMTPAEIIKLYIYLPLNEELPIIDFSCN